MLQKAKMICQSKVIVRKTNKSKLKVKKRVSDSSSIGTASRFFLKSFILILFGFIVLFPFYFMLTRALMTYDEATNPAGGITPDKLQWINFALAFQSGYLFAMFVSLSIVALDIILRVLVCALLGYAFANYNFKFKNTLWFFLMLTMALPEIALLSGQFRVVTSLGLDTSIFAYLGLVAPFVASIFTGYMFKNAFQRIPNAIREAAMIDGVSGAKYFIRMAMPMVRSTTWTVMTLCMFSTWNSYMWPSLILQNTSIITMPMWLFTVGLSQDGSGMMFPQIQMAGAVLTILPTFTLYFFFRSRINSSAGNSIGGNKG